jgi:FkbM family methyltransferase
MIFGIPENLKPFCPDNESLLKALSRLTPGLAVDVGAFDGRDAMTYARAGHHVLSFEPVPSKVERIMKAFAEDPNLSKNITFYNIALASTKGTTKFWVSGKGSQQDQMSPPPWTSTDKSLKAIDVPTDSLDNIVKGKYVSFLKVDSQGSDPIVLSGAKRLIEQKRIGIIQFEVAPRLSNDTGKSYIELLNYLALQNYVCYDCALNMFKESEDGIPVTFSVSIRARITHLIDSSYIFKDSNHGQWSNFVCIVSDSSLLPGYLYKK